MAIRVQREDFDVGAEIAAITTGRADVGAVVTFTGRVRGDEGGVAAMTLEHYPGMTEAELSRIEAEAQSRWQLQASLIETLHAESIVRFGSMQGRFSR